MSKSSHESLAVMVSVAGSLLLGLSGLVAYVPGLELLGRVRPDYIPMAPSTSCSFILLSISIVVFKQRRVPVFGQRIIIVGIALVALFGLLELLGFFLGADLNFEDKMVPAFGQLNGIPVGRMSPSTGTLFFFSGFVMLCLFLGKKVSHNKILRQIAGCFSCIVVFSAMTFLLGYLYGTPLLYDQQTIPMAFTTAMGFVFLSVGFFAVIGMKYFPMSVFSGTTTAVHLMRVLLPWLVIYLIIQEVIIHVIHQVEGETGPFLDAVMTVVNVIVLSTLLNVLLKKIGNRIDLAEGALRTSEERLQKIVSKSPIPMSIVNINGDVEFLNQAFTKALGYTIDDMPTMKAWWELAYSDQEQQQKMQEAWKQMLIDAQSTGREIDPINREVRHKNGELRSVEFRLMPLGDILIMTMLDQTEQVLLLKELSAGEARLAEAQRLAHLGGWEWDMVEDSLWWSDEVYRIFGLRPGRSTVTYDVFLQAVHPQDRQHVQVSVDLALKNTVPYNIEHRIILPDGEVKTVHQRAKVSYNEEGIPIFMSGTVQDISERKILEKQLIQATKMESIGLLSAGVAHEINTPTQFIQHNMRFFQNGFNDLVLLLQEYEKLRDATVSDSHLAALHTGIHKRSDAIEYEYLLSEIPQAIEQSLDGLSQIKRIVQSVKLFAHTSSPEKVETDINSLIETVITVSTNEWKYHSDIHQDLDSTISSVLCVPDQINQALLNLIVNAAHTNTDKVQSGSSEKVGLYVSTKMEEDFLVIIVRDEGMGIPEENRDILFDPFFTTKELGKGTGQGLALAYRTIVEVHGGTIDYETVLGEGTTFTVKLPL